MEEDIDIVYHIQCQTLEQIFKLERETGKIKKGNILMKVPEFLKKVKNFTLSMAKIALDGFETVPEEELERRWNICKSCPKFVKTDGYAVCSLSKSGCGCHLSEDSTKYINKLIWRASVCPDNPPRWKEYEQPENKENQEIKA